MKKFFFTLLVLLAGACVVPAAYADQAITVNNQNVAIDFPKNMTFNLDVTSTSDIQSTTLVLKFPSVTRTLRAKITPGKQVTAKIVWDLSSDQGGIAGGYVPPGVTFDYTWTIEDSAGNKFTTDPKSFEIIDNREDWQTLESDALAIHWYNAPKSFGQAVFDAGTATLQKLREELGATNSNKVHVWLYTDQDTFRTSIPFMDSWVGGQSFGEYNVTILDTSPSNVTDAEQGTQHELTHQVIYEGLGAGISQSAFPHWLNEGLATYNQFNGQGIPDYMNNPLQDAIKNNGVPSLKSRASAFPPDPTEALLSYAMSYSIVDMLFKNFGATKVTNMFNLFKTGIGDDQVFQQAFGTDTNGLDNMWRKSVGLPQRDYSNAGIPTPKAIPTFSLSSAETPVSNSGGVQATATPAQVSVANTSAPAPTVSRSNPNNSTSGSASTGLCGIGGLAFAVFGAYGWRKRKSRTTL